MTIVSIERYRRPIVERCQCGHALQVHVAGSGRCTHPGCKCTNLARPRRKQ